MPGAVMSQEIEARTTPSDGDILQLLHDDIQSNLHAMISSAIQTSYCRSSAEMAASLHQQGTLELLFMVL